MFAHNKGGIAYQDKSQRPETLVVAMHKVEAQHKDWPQAAAPPQLQQATNTRPFGVGPQACSVAVLCVAVHSLLSTVALFVGLPQPAIYVASLAAVEKLRATEGAALLDSVDVTCGLSLGEYTALAFAGAHASVAGQQYAGGPTTIITTTTTSSSRTRVHMAGQGPSFSSLIIWHRLSAPSCAADHMSRWCVACILGDICCAGAMSFEDGLKLVKLRGESMQAAADAAKSGMVSVIGLNKEKVAELCEAATKEVRG
jgi:hypothetical protein